MSNRYSGQWVVTCSYPWKVCIKIFFWVEVVLQISGQSLQCRIVSPGVSPLFEGFWTVGQDAVYSGMSIPHNLQLGSIFNLHLRRLRGVGSVFVPALKRKDNYQQDDLEGLSFTPGCHLQTAALFSQSSLSLLLCFSINIALKSLLHSQLGVLLVMVVIEDLAFMSSLSRDWWDSLALDIFFSGKYWKYFLDQRIFSGRDRGEKG